MNLGRPRHGFIAPTMDSDACPSRGRRPRRGSWDLSDIPTGIVADGGKLSPWAAIVGPCYTVSSLCRILGASQEAVADAAAELRLLRLLTADGLDLFPAFQVRGEQVHPDLRSVLQVLQSGIDDPWTWAQ